MNINTKALKGVIEEVEASRARQKGEAEFQREAIKRAVKEHQLDGKAIRIVLQRRAMGDQKRDEQDYFVHAYELALGEKKHAADALAAGAGVRETARATGLSVGTVSALKQSVQKSSDLNTAPQPEYGDDGITESCGKHPATADGPEVVSNEGGSHEADIQPHQLNPGRLDRISDETDESLAAGVAVQSDGGDDDAGRLSSEPEVARVAPPVSFNANEAPATPSVGAAASESERVARSSSDGDDLEFPPFLKRARQGERRGA